MANNSTAILTVIGNGTSPVSQRYCSGASPLTIGLMTASFMIMGLSSLVGNVLIINVIRTNKLLRSTVDLLIVNMCVSDLFIPLFSIPFNIKKLHVADQWFDGFLGSALCKFVPFAIDFSTTVSVLSMLAIAVERYHCVHYATKSSFFTTSIHLVIFLIWLIAILNFSVYFYAFRIVPGLVNSTVNCVPIWSSNTTYAMQVQTIFFTTQLDLFIGVPLIVISLLYTSVAVSLRQQKVRIAGHLASEALRRQEKENKRVTLMLLIAVVVFATAFVPFSAGMFVNLYSFSSIVSTCGYFLSSHWLWYSPSAINPVVYFTFNAKYRHELKKLCSTTLCQPRRFSGATAGSHHGNNTLKEVHDDANCAVKLREIGSILWKAEET